jgi:hypothetical protein
VDNIVVEIPDPILVSPISRRFSARGMTHTNVLDDYNEPPVYLYP